MQKKNTQDKDKHDLKILNTIKENYLKDGSPKCEIDIDSLDLGFKQEFRYGIAEIIKKENLDYVNRNDKNVIVNNSVYVKYIKRFLDLVISAFALVVLLPVNLLLAVGTFFDVGTPIMFFQKRVGKNLKPFNIVKFRNMTNDVDQNGNLLPANERVTKFGSFVRKTSLDELLNFWCIFKGDMSIIGPRPLPEGYLERFSERHKKRHDIRPGLECPCLNNSEYRSSWTQQFENDINYVENVSLFLDIKMCFSLFRMVFDKKSSSTRSKSDGGTFMGYEKNGECINSHNVPVKYVIEYIDQYYSL